MAENQKYSLDATDYFAAITKIVSKNKELAASLGALGEDIAKNAKAVNQHQKVIENAKNLPQELLAQYLLLGAQYDKTGNKLTILNSHLKEHQTELEKTTNKYLTAFMRQADIVLDAETKKQNAIAQTNRMMAGDIRGRASGTATRAGTDISFDPLSTTRTVIQTGPELAASKKAVLDRQRLLEQQVTAFSAAMLKEATATERTEKKKQKEYRDTAKTFEASMLRQVNQHAAAQRQMQADSIRRSAAIGGGGWTGGGKVVSDAPEFGRPIKQLEDFTAAAEEAEKKHKKATDGILLSWKSMVRLFVIQAAHTAVREFINAIEASIAATVKWQIKISEIRTITQDAPKSFQEWADSVRALSDAFGSPILEVTEGLYETISNQVGKGTTAINFMNKAMEFSKVTGASTADSVNLLSSALNSFELSTSETDRVAAIFFKTIDKGRLRAEDIANTFGRVGPSAHALGISLEEVGAALATLTIKGVPPHEAMTLLNNVMKGLISPSKEMKEVFEDWNVSTGEQAIQIKSLAGVLVDLEQKTRGSSSEIAKLFEDVRGRRGATIFSGEGLKTFQANLDAMRKSAEDFHKAFQIAMESPGAQLMVQLNRVKNFVITDFGVPAVQAILSVANALSDDGLTGVVRGLIDVVKGGLVVYSAYKAVTLVNMKLLGETGIITTNLAAQEARRVQISGARANLLAVEIELTTILNELELASTLGHTQKIAVLETEAAVMMQTRASILSGTAALAAQSTMLSRTGASLASLGGGIAATLTNPVFLFTAAIAGLIFLVHEYYEEQRRFTQSVKDAYQAGVDFNQKLTEVTERELSKQREAYLKELNARYAAYTDFATKVENRAEQLAEREIDLVHESTEAAKASLDEYVKAYTDAMNKRQAENDRVTENIRKTEEELDRNKADFAENEYKRALKLAEHNERMKNPGAKGSPVSGEQIALTAAEIARLRAENAKLLQPTGSGKTDAERLRQAAENTQKIDNLLTNQADKRFQIEEGRQRIVEQIAELEAQQAARATERATKDEQAAIRQQQRAESRKTGRRSDPIKFNLDDQSASKQAELSAEQRAEQDRITAKKLEELKTTLQNYDASLKALPQINEIQQQGVNLQKEMNALLEKRRDILKKTAADEQKKIDDEKANFVILQTAIEALTKFKLDPKLDVTNLADVNKQFDKYDELVKKAEAAGLIDQKIAAENAKRRIDMENQVTAAREKIAQQGRAKELAANKKDLETQIEQQNKAISELQQTAGAVANQLFAVIGGPTKDGKKPVSPIEQIGQPILDTIPDSLAKMRQLVIDITSEQAKALATNTIYDPKRIEELRAKYAQLKKELDVEQNDFWKNLPIGQERFDESGKSLGKVKLGEFLAQGEKGIDALVIAGNTINDAIKKRIEQAKKLDELREKERQAFPDLAPRIEAQAKSFDQLNRETIKLLESMVKFNTWIEQQKNNPSGTPLAPVKYAFGGPIGTDTMVAAVTPGEFVMNKAATKRFLPQLTRMNRYENGGLIGWNPNFTRPSYEIPTGSPSVMGGVTIESIVIQGVTPDYDARTIGTAIQREVRLGRLSPHRSDEQ